MWQKTASPYRLAHKLCKRYNEKTFHLNGIKFTWLAYHYILQMSLLFVYIHELHNLSFQTVFSRKCKCVSVNELYPYIAEAKCCLYICKTYSLYVHRESKRKQDTKILPHNFSKC